MWRQRLVRSNFDALLFGVLFFGVALFGVSLFDVSFCGVPFFGATFSGVSFFRVSLRLILRPFKRLQLRDTNSLQEPTTLYCFVPPFSSPF